MPSKRYRRKLVAATSGSTGLTQYIVGAPPVEPITEPNCEIDQIRAYFLEATNMITEYMDFASAVDTIQGILGSIQTVVDYYKILEQIEIQLLGIVGNIAKRTSVELIRIRINHIRSYIERMPPTYQNRGEISEMIMQVIAILVANIGISEVSTAVDKITSYVKSKYKDNNCIEAIQTLITSIIENIGNGVSPGIVGLRVEYLKGLIAKMTVTA
jgi:hypothetical protein